MSRAVVALGALGALLLLMVTRGASAAVSPPGTIPTYSYPPEPLYDPALDPSPLFWPEWPEPSYPPAPQPPVYTPIPTTAPAPTTPAPLPSVPAEIEQQASIYTDDDGYVWYYDVDGNYVGYYDPYDNLFYPVSEGIMTTQPTTPATPISEDQSAINLYAFLRMIRLAEGTEGPAAESRGFFDPYRVYYGYRGPIQDLSDHPINTGEFGYIPGPSGPTSAAGAYQIVATTWNTTVRNALCPPYAFCQLDFSPESQDAAAIALLRFRNAADDVIAGNFEAAINKLGKEWASLPSSTDTRQGTRSWDQVSAWYEESGGNYA